MPVYNPMAEMVQGLMQAHGIANQIRRSAMEREEFEASKIDRERRRNREDLTTRMQLASAARPALEGGKIRESLSLGIPTDGLPSTVAAAIPQTATINRQVDPARRITYTGADGKTNEYEAFSRDDLVNQRMDELRGASHVKIAGALDELRAGVGPDARSREATAAANARHEADILTRLGLAQGGWDAANTRAEADRKAREELAKLQRDAMLEAARMREAGRGRMTAGQAAEGERSAATRQRQEEEAVRKLDKDIETLHSHARMLGTASSAKDGETVAIPAGEGSKTVKLTETIKGQLADQAREIKARLDELTKDRDRKASALGWGASKGGKKAAVATPAASGPKKGDKQTYQGFEYVFDGTQWTR